MNTYRTIRNNTKIWPDEFKFFKINKAKAGGNYSLQSGSLIATVWKKMHMITLQHSNATEIQTFSQEEKLDNVIRKKYCPKLHQS
jgi:hypothetical protein